MWQAGAQLYLACAKIHMATLILYPLVKDEKNDLTKFREIKLIHTLIHTHTHTHRTSHT